MRVTAPDDGDLHTHEDAEQLLRYALPGARVDTYEVRTPGTVEASASVRRYEITIARIGRTPVTSTHVYSLPAHAETLARGARQVADAALIA